ncbi:hypothetical protein CH296_26785 [Rhodococcus sp. 14-2496-1d]|nr:hypothetical protein CH296_26785 [Rhodococcus sp. 14-2496-1d]
MPKATPICSTISWADDYTLTHMTGYTQSNGMPSAHSEQSTGQGFVQLCLMAGEPTALLT